MIPSNTHQRTAARGFRRAYLQATSDLLAPRARRRCADRVRARPRLEGLEDRHLLSVTVTEFPIPNSKANPGWIAAGPDGNLWFTDAGTNSIGTINPATHAITEFPVPTRGANPRGITAGRDGNLWFVEVGGNNIGVINPNTHKIAEFPVPTAAASLYFCTAGPDGNIWFTESATNKIGMISPATHVVTEFSQGLTAGAFPEAIAAGSDGNLWFTESNANKIGRITTSGTITEFSQGLTANAWPWRISAGPDGNLWFAEHDAHKIGMINPATQAITESSVPNGNIPNGISAGADGNLWFAEAASSIGMIDPATQAITEFPIPYAGSYAVGITSGPDGNLWFADGGTRAIGVVVLNHTSEMHLVMTQQPPATMTAGSLFGLTVQAQDSSGNLITSFNGTFTVELASNPGGATLGGTLVAAGSGGMAAFSGLTLTKAASGYTLYVSASGFTSTTTGSITVTPASPTQLVITQQPPATVKVSSPFAMKAAIEDQYGNVVTTSTGSVSVALLNNPTGATLGGTTTVTASQGMASFTNLTINKVGSGYTLRVTSGSLTSATSNPIDVTQNGKAPSTLLASAPAGTVATDLSLAPLVLDSPDLWDGVRFKRRSGLI